MKKSLVITINIVIWVALVIYLVFSFRYVSDRKESRLCSRIEVTVLDSAERRFITPAMVRGWFETEKMQLTGKELVSINTQELDRFIRRRGFVRTSRVYTSMDGCLHIELTQRTPMIRFNTPDGYNFYITEDLYVLPAQRHFVVYVPVVTGYFRLPFKKDYVGSLEACKEGNEKKTAKNYTFLINLINFVKFAEGDDFWRAFIEQIQVESIPGDEVFDPDVTIVPRAGDQVVILGSIDDYPEKLDKLQRFYKYGIAYEGWTKYSCINLKYKGQVVCSP